MALFFWSTALLAVIALIPAQTHALYGGKSLSHKEREMTKPIVKVVMEALSASGTATYLGNGLFLTAFHNLAETIENYEAYRKKDSLRIIDNEKNEILKIPRSEYEILLPDIDNRTFFKTVKFGKAYNIPSHDLVLLQVSEKLTPQLSSLPAARLSSTDLKIGENLFIVGFGPNEKSDNMPAIAVFSTPSKINIDGARLNYNLDFRTEQYNFETVEGDSGGPVFRKTNGGALEVVAVVSRLLIDSKTHKNAMMVFSRADIPAVLDMTAILLDVKTQESVQNKSAVKMPKISATQIKELEILRQQEWRPEIIDKKILNALEVILNGSLPGESLRELSSQVATDLTTPVKEIIKQFLKSNSKNSPISCRKVFSSL